MSGFCVIVAAGSRSRRLAQRVPEAHLAVKRSCVWWRENCSRWQAGGTGRARSIGVIMASSRKQGGGGIGVAGCCFNRRAY